MKELSIIGTITAVIVALVAVILWLSGLQAPDQRTILPTAEPAALPAPAERTPVPAPIAATVVPRAAEPTTALPAPVAQRMLPADRGLTLEYVALGDSSVYGVGASSPERNYVNQLAIHLRSAYPQTEVTNLGVPGATAADVAEEQLTQAVAANPNLITLSVGPNDITQGRDVEAYERDINTILRTLTE